MGTAPDYESFIAGLVRDLLRKRRISNLRHGSKNRLTGRSGATHQLDVSFVDNELSPNALVVIECKCLTKKIDLSHVKVLKATLDDLLGASGNASVGKAMIVSTKGAQRGAKQYAKYYGLDVQSVSDGPAYTLSYQGLSLVAATGTSDGSNSAQAHGVALRPCKVCGTTFETNGR